MSIIGLLTMTNKFNLRKEANKVVFDYTNSKGQLKTVNVPEVINVDGVKVKFATLTTKRDQNKYLKQVVAQYQEAAQKAKDAWNNKTQEEKDVIIAKSKANQKIKEYTDEERKALSEAGKARWNALSDEEKEAVIAKSKANQKVKEYTDEERKALSEAGKARWNSLSDEEKEAVIAKSIANQKEYTDEERQQMSEAGKARWNSLSDAEKEDIRQKAKASAAKRAEELANAVLV